AQTHHAGAVALESPPNHPVYHNGRWLSMTCRRAYECIEAYIIGDLAPELADELEAHLRDCESCRRQYEEQKRLIALLRRAFRVRQRFA
ncbi:MAG: zf-HC2 domain-containing protein, partial [Fimbriimonadales bacterium]|nr:zf-HC2 domain-containing protein [Fimbriimonadales bacterium]